MSDVTTHELDEAPVELGASLRARMQQRRETLENERTLVADVPGFDGVLEVELRALSWQTCRKIAQSHDKIRDGSLRELYTACDQLLRATDGFREVRPEGSQTISTTWLELARAAGHKLMEDATPRIAMLALVGDMRVMGLWLQWTEWARGQRNEVEEEVVRDFGTTP